MQEGKSELMKLEPKNIPNPDYEKIKVPPSEWELFFDSEQDANQFVTFIRSKNEVSELLAAHHISVYVKD